MRSVTADNFHTIAWHFGLYTLLAATAMVYFANFPGSPGSPIRPTFFTLTMEKNSTQRTPEKPQRLEPSDASVEMASLEQDFIRRGLAPPTQPPVDTISSAAEVLGDLPRFFDHNYYEADFQLQLDYETNSVLTAGNSIYLLPDKVSWETKVQLMREASETLYVTSMIMRCDEGGMQFVEEMAAAAKRGVDTRFILDGLFAAYAVPCLNRMKEAGVEVTLSLRSLRPDMLDWEMHEKLMIVDAERAVIGGQNVGSWYFDSTGIDENYRDTDVLLEGPIVCQIARRFVQLWSTVGPKDSNLRSYSAQLDVLEAQDRQNLHLGSDQYSNWLAPVNRQGLCRFVAQDPYEKTFYVWTAYQRYIEAARKNVMLTAYALAPTGSPYQNAFRNALIQLAEKPGARVDIIMNGAGVGASRVVPELIKTPYTTRILRRSWRGFGTTPVRIWTYHHFMHAKQYYFDGIAASIGSFNYDNSGNKCQESVVICIDPGLVSDVETLFARDIANSTLLSGERIEQ